MSYFDKYSFPGVTLKRKALPLSFYKHSEICASVIAEGGGLLKELMMFDNF